MKAQKLKKSKSKVKNIPIVKADSGAEIEGMYLSIHVYICVYLQMYVYVCIYSYLYIRIYLYTYMHVHMYLYIYMYKFILIYRERRRGHK
jgi:hypothetical protein